MAPAAVTAPAAPRRRWHPGLTMTTPKMPAADATLRVLTFLAAQRAPIAAARIAQQLGLARSTTYDLLAPLSGHGYVMHLGEERLYGLGPAAQELSGAYLRQEPLARFGRRVIETMVDDVGESGHLAVLHGRDVLYVVEERARNRPSLVTDVGVRISAHLTASGRAILAELPPAQLRALFGTREDTDLRLAGEKDVHVSCLCPDGMWTPMLFDKLEEPGASMSFSGVLLQPEQIAERALRILERPRAVTSVPRWRACRPGPSTSCRDSPPAWPHGWSGSAGSSSGRPPDGCAAREPRGVRDTGQNRRGSPRPASSAVVSCREHRDSPRPQEPKMSLPGARPVRAARGTSLSAKSWQTEAPLRMLMNNLDPEVAERPDDLVVYGGTGRAARSWEAFDAIVDTLKDLEADETLLVQSGKPVGVLRTHEWAPRVLLANSNLVGDWATWPEFRRLEAEGLMMYGQMTAGSWIYIATQGILQGTYETFAAVAQKRFGGTLAGTVTLTGGCGGMGGAQPLAVTLNDGVCLMVDVDRTRLERRVGKRYLHEIADDLEDAIARANAAKEAKQGLSLGIVGNAAEVFPALLERHRAGDLHIDVVTDQTSAHDPLSYLPSEITVEDWQREADADPEGFTKKSREAMARQVQAMVEFQDAGAEVFDYGNSIRDEARHAGYDRAFEFPGFVPAYIRPLFCEGLGPFRWVALSGDPEDITVTDAALKELFPDNEHLHRWLDAAEEFVEFEGLPARICWLGYGERHKAGMLFNDLVRDGKVKAPIVIGRDHLDSGSVASPYRETESMLDGSDAIADWPLLNALTSTSSGATWVSIHHGGGVGIGRSIHAGQVGVADGTPLARQKLERLLTNDPAMGVIRHVDAGYSRADEVAHERGVRVPMTPVRRD